LNENSISSALIALVLHHPLINATLDADVSSFIGPVTVAIVIIDTVLTDDAPGMLPSIIETDNAVFAVVNITLDAEGVLGVFAHRRQSTSNAFPSASVSR
jgi:hypothetical protein